MASSFQSQASRVHDHGLSQLADGDPLESPGGYEEWELRGQDPCGSECLVVELRDGASSLAEVEAGALEPCRLASVIEKAMFARPRRPSDLL